ncbi:MAG: hypothetical protein AB8F65_01880 [Woeseiaceae bacterium]
MSEKVESADPFAKRLLAHYLGRRVSDVHLMKEALADCDFERIRVTGHNMFGSGEAYGLKPISDFGRAIEQAALDKNTGDLSDMVDQLDTYLKGLVIS